MFRIQIGISRFPELTDELEQAREGNSSLKSALDREQLRSKELRKQVLDFFNLEKDLIRKRKTLINLFE